LVQISHVAWKMIHENRLPDATSSFFFSYFSKFKLTRNYFSIHVTHVTK